MNRDRPDARRCPIASIADPERPSTHRRRVVLATLTLVAGSYFVCAAVATYPVVLSLDSRMPGQLTDPLEHLWLMRWSRDCLAEGRSPFFCPSLNAPTGVPLGYFPTMHVQTLAYLLLSQVTDNDVLCFNALWFSGFVATGLGTFVLAWWAVRKVVPAWLAGLGSMLCGPMLMHAHGHLETMQMGAVPLFLIAWLRLVDSPSTGRLVGALGLYLLMVGCAPYFAVLAIFPAAWYVVWSLLGTRIGASMARLNQRSAWLGAFAVLALSGLALLFSSQVWAASHGYSMGRTRQEFDQLGAPGWSTFLPTPLHTLGRLGSTDFFAATGYSSRMSECSSYLGVVTLVTLAYGAIRRVRFARAGYWWSMLVMMVVLSWGSGLDLGWTKIAAPAGWIYGVFPPFHLIRVPARFNLFAAVCAAVPVAAGLADVIGRIGRKSCRVGFATVCAGLMLADLSMVPFETTTIPPMPGVYRTLASHKPDTGLVEVPMFGSNEGQVFSSLWGYWQSIHHARTTAGYPGLPNVTFDAEVVRPSPFWAGRLVNPAYLVGSTTVQFGPVDGVDPRDYAWLYLTAHRFDHVVVHQGIFTDPKYAAGNARLKSLLAEAKGFEDADVAVFDRDRLRPPDRLAWLCVGGFRPGLASAQPWLFGVLRAARIAIINPTPERPILIELTDVSAFARSRVVRLMAENVEVARWTVEPGVVRTLKSPSFRIGTGVREVKVITDGDDRPTRFVDRLDDARTPYGLRINAVKVRLADE